MVRYVVVRLKVSSNRSQVLNKELPFLIDKIVLRKGTEIKLFDPVSGEVLALPEMSFEKGDEVLVASSDRHIFVLDKLGGIQEVYDCKINRYVVKMI